MRDTSKSSISQSSKLTPPSITLYVIPPPAPLDWSTPSKLLRSVTWNYALQKLKPPQHYIGHINVELCSRRGEKILVGQTSDKDLRYEMRVLRNRMNVKEMILDPQPGRLFTPQEIREEQERRFLEGSIAGVKFLLSEPAYMLLADYLKRYVTLGMHERFGTLDTDPLRGEPAGCSSFAIAYLRLAGLLEPNFHRHWKREMHIAPELLERGSSPKFWSLITMDSWEWAEPGENHGRDLEFWDPELMFSWIKGVACRERDFDRDHYFERRGRADILVIDRRDAELFDGLDPKEINCLRNHYRLPLEIYESAQTRHETSFELSSN